MAKTPRISKFKKKKKICKKIRKERKKNKVRKKNNIRKINFLQLPSDIHYMILDYINPDVKNENANILKRYFSDDINKLLESYKNMGNLSLTCKNMKFLVNSYFKSISLLNFFISDKIVLRIYKNFFPDSIEWAFLFLLIFREIVKVESPAFVDKFKIFGGFMRDLFYQQNQLSLNSIDETIKKIIANNVGYRVDDIDICINGDAEFLRGEVEKIIKYFNELSNKNINFECKKKYRIGYLNDKTSFLTTIRMMMGDAEGMKLDLVINSSTTKDFTCNLLMAPLDLKNIEISQLSMSVSDIDEKRVKDAILKQEIEPLFLILNTNMNKINIIDLIKRMIKRLKLGWKISHDIYLKFIKYIGDNFFANSEKYKKFNDSKYSIEEYKKYSDKHCNVCGIYLEIDYYFYTRGHAYDSFNHYLCFIKEKLKILK